MDCHIDRIGHIKTESYNYIILGKRSAIIGKTVIKIRHRIMLNKNGIRRFLACQVQLIFSLLRKGGICEKSRIGNLNYKEFKFDHIILMHTSRFDRT